ncbi:hypothetical protein [Jannaschia seohaensis]|uniref:Uncharacterized protein n=1 Tax=Jannaschia seohaensis TaxID=475081 RepID=A0A2Y9B0X6_9RHOB|nr:hypothetical protein [Jannaschia seohaensis]PWJ14396.1 hypothetical protein BCF38_11219 [Jannaschia seohaensis]SSA50111.1 hypothetical protein SAMN05421539_11219 [Jannaschia seohaensis]
MLRHGIGILAPRLVAVLPVLAVALSSPAKAESDIIVTAFAGAMTDNVWEEAILVWDAEFIESGLVGLAVGQDLFHRGRLSLGYEVQVVKNFGQQDQLELNAPLVVRYDRAGQPLPAIGSLAFGLGLSWASEKPPVEIDDDGDTTQTLFY